MANAWADILLRSDAETTSDKWSSRKTSVAYKKTIICIDLLITQIIILTLFARGRQSKILSINLAFPSGSSGRQTAGKKLEITNEQTIIYQGIYPTHPRSSGKGTA